MQRAKGKGAGASKGKQGKQASNPWYQSSETLDQAFQLSTRIALMLAEAFGASYTVTAGIAEVVIEYVPWADGGPLSQPTE